MYWKKIRPCTAWAITTVRDCFRTWHLICLGNPEIGKVSLRSQFCHRRLTASWLSSPKPQLRLVPIFLYGWKRRCCCRQRRCRRCHWRCRCRRHRHLKTWPLRLAGNSKVSQVLSLIQVGSEAFLRSWVFKTVPSQLTSWEQVLSLTSCLVWGRQVAFPSMNSPVVRVWVLKLGSLSDTRSLLIRFK